MSLQKKMSQTFSFYFILLFDYKKYKSQKTKSLTTRENKHESSHSSSLFQSQDLSVSKLLKPKKVGKKKKKTFDHLSKKKLSME